MAWLCFSLLRTRVACSSFRREGIVKLLDIARDYFVSRNTYLRRIAEALERIAPIADAPVELKPEDAVTYADDVRMAQREQAEEAGQLERWMTEHAEELEQAEGYGE